MNKFEEIVSLCKRRGFVYPSSEIYGGLANVYDYGPLGAELLLNIKKAWWDKFVTKRIDVVGLDSSVLMSPRIWEASGHTASFSDVMVDCKACQLRTRADNLIEKNFEQKEAPRKVEGLKPEQLDELIQKEHINCPNCAKFNWTGARSFNLLF